MQKGSGEMEGFFRKYDQTIASIGFILAILFVLAVLVLR